MARLDEVASAALANWWGLAQSAASGGFTVTDTISAASEIARSQGTSLTFEESRAISQLYGFARRMENASNALQDMSAGDVIDSEQISVPPWARDEAAMLTAPIWHATFEFQYVDAAGQLQTDFRTSVFDMTMPDTFGGLADALEQDGEAMAAKYGVTFLSATPVSLLAV